MQVILAASGGGSRGTMTEDCWQALGNASCIIRQASSGVFTVSILFSPYQQRLLNPIKIQKLFCLFLARRI